MFEIAGFRLTEIIANDSRFAIVRAIKESDGQAVILKSHAYSVPSVDDIKLLINEYEVMREVESPYLRRPLELLHLGARKVLAYEDDHLPSLDLFIKTTELSIDDKIQIAMEITRALSGLVAFKITHRDLKPQNMLIDPKTFGIKFINFTLARVYSAAGKSASSNDHPAGTLAYMSPEQYGRVGRVTDHRSDFYSAGVVFYQLFTRSLPFESADPLELAYSHGTLEPEAPHKRVVSIPPDVGRLILRLLAKSPEDRYQTVTGLLYDWQLCLIQWQAQYLSKNLELGTRDRSPTLTIPDKLYGRDEETKLLLNHLELKKKIEIQTRSDFRSVRNRKVFNCP